MLRQFCRKNGTLNICVRTTFVLSVLGVLAFGGVMTGAGYHLGTIHAAVSPPDNGEVRAAAEATAAIGEWVEQERGNLEQVRKETEDHLDALAMRLASLQAEMMRIGAVGEPLAARMARRWERPSPPAI